MILMNYKDRRSPSLCLETKIRRTVFPGFSLIFICFSSYSTLFLLCSINNNKLPVKTYTCKYPQNDIKTAYPQIHGYRYATGNTDCQH